MFTVFAGRPVRLSVAALLAACLAALPATAGPHMLVEVESGRVLEHEDAFQRWYPASLTKLMTAYIAFRAIESGDAELTSPVTLSERAAAEPPSKMYYGEGATMTLDTALKIIMVKSANDVAMAIGESLAGSEKAFVKRMNEAARRLGMNSTRFVNPHGLPGEGQYTTARDMAVLARALKQDFPQYDSYFSIEAIQSGDDIYSSYNMLIGRFPGADGMKTGFICSAGFNQVSSATRGGKSVITVVLGADSLADRAEESARLLHEGLTGPSASRVTLDSLEPYGEGRYEVVDLRSEICTPEAAEARAEERDEDGELILDSRYILPPDEEVEVVAVALGGAGGRIAHIVPYAPIPTPRPEPVGIVDADPEIAVAETAAVETEAMGDDSSADSVRSPAEIPLPEPRPAL